MSPLFLGLGAPRCGSTWLYRLLKLHPQILLTREKEATFWGRECIGRSLADYRALFEAPSTKPRGFIRGDISPWYCRISRQSIRAVRQFFPQTRLVLVIRNPIERAWSELLLERLILHNRRPDNMTVGYVLRKIQRARQVRRSDYGAIIEDWTSVFGSSALHIDLYDRLCAEPINFLGDVLRHIGADATWQPPDVELHTHYWSMSELSGGKSKMPEMPEIVRWYLACQWRDRVRQLNKRLNGRVAHWVSDIEQITGRSAPITWSVRRLLSRSILCWPERLSYALFNELRELRLSLAYSRLEQERHNSDTQWSEPFASEKPPIPTDLTQLVG